MHNKKESGEVVVEASIVVTLVMLIITIMLYVGMVLYQQTLVSVMANQTASNIAQVYSNALRDPFTGYIDEGHVYQSTTYSDMRSDAYLEVLEKKAVVLAKYRLKSSRILVSEGTSVDVEVVRKPNELFKSQIIVTIHDRYDVPLVGMLGVDGGLKYSSSGRADCIDYLEYFNGVDAIADFENAPIQYIDPIINKSCLVSFITNRDEGRVLTTVPVMQGKSISSSNRYTHSTMPMTPRFSDLTFLGWETESGENFSALTPVNRDLRVYGRWECKVTLNPNGGTISTGVVPVKYGACIDLNRLDVPVKPGYVFEGWNDSTGGTYVALPVKQNIELTAVWRCLHRDGNGASKVTMAEKVQYLCSEVGGERKSYILYKCTDCEYSYRETIENKHYIDEDYLINTDELIATSGAQNDFTAQCNVNHLTGSVSGTSGSYSSEFNSANISWLSHITCKHCGMHAPAVWWDNVTGAHVMKEIFWTSDVSSRDKTECRTPAWRGN